MNLKKFIKTKEKEKRHFTWRGVQIFLKDPILNPEVSLMNVLGTIDKKIPSHLLKNLDTIYVGDFDFFKDREIQAMYENSSIFVTNNQKNEEDMCDDIIHEIAHSVEDMHKDLIYSDGALESEFKTKREKLYLVLKGEGVPANLSDFSDCAYREEFDEYLYKEVGYPLLNMVSSNIFYSPYAITSLREYFANGFEAYFYYGDYDFVKKTCPQLFNKLNALLEIGYD
jgi:hypothetical protein